MQEVLEAPAVGEDEFNDVLPPKMFDLNSSDEEDDVEDMAYEW